MKRSKTVAEYIAESAHWVDELYLLRKILQATQLEETIKWGAPCYVHKGKNLMGLAAFKSYVGLWFHQGALLTDPEKVLTNAQEGKTRAMRQWRFQSAGEINRPLIKTYINEAISLQEQGQEIKSVRDKALVMPKLLTVALAQNRNAHDAFSVFSKSKQREYADYIGEAKREQTRIKRLEKVIPMIAAGEGLHDKYRK